MSTEPHIKSKHLKAAFSGSVYALLLPLTFIFIFIFFEAIYPPDNPENDGYLRVFAQIVALMFPLFFIYFIYYMFMCIWQNIRLKTALIISGLIPFSISFLLYYPSDVQASFSAIASAFAMPTFFALSLCIGSWGWHRKLKNITRN